MAFPAVQGTPAETAVSTAGTSHAINLPAGIAAGELLLIFLDKGSTAGTFNALAGWTELVDENSGNGITVWARQADGAEGATVTFTHSSSTRSASISFRVSGAQLLSVQAPELSTVATGSSTSPNATTCTPTGGAKDYLWFSFFGRDGEEADDDTWVTAPPSTPSAFTGLLQKACGVAGTNLGGMIAVAQLAANAASLDAGAFTCATGGWRAYTLAVHPAPPIYLDEDQPVLPPPATGWMDAAARVAAVAVLGFAACTEELAVASALPATTPGPGDAAHVITVRTVLPRASFPAADEDLAFAPVTAAVEDEGWSLPPPPPRAGPPPVAWDDEALAVVAAPVVVDDDGPWAPLAQTIPWRAVAFRDDETGAALANFALEQEEPWAPLRQTVPWTPFVYTDDEARGTPPTSAIDDEQPWAGLRQTIPWTARAFADDEIGGQLKNFSLDQEEGWAGLRQAVPWTAAPVRDDDQFPTILPFAEEDGAVPGRQVVPWAAVWFAADEDLARAPLAVADEDPPWPPPAPPAPWTARLFADEGLTPGTTPSVILPAPGDVRFGVYYDEFNLPAPGDVRAGVVYG